MIKETLYSLDKKGKIRVFVCEVIENKIITKTGLLNGKLIEKSIIIKKGEQGRSLLQQVHFKANSLIKEKQNEGYKSLLTLENRAAFLDISINKEDIEDIFEKLDIKFNTNANWNPLPMLAEKWKEHKGKVKYPGIIQPKLNGVRASIYWNEGVVIGSRGGSYYKIPHISTLLHAFLSENRNIILDGEIYKHGVPLQIISGAVRDEEDSLFNTKKEFLEFWIYDIVDKSNLKMTQQLRENLRIKIISDIYRDYKAEGIIVSVPSLIVNNEKQVDEISDSFLKAGYEGAMWRDISESYKLSFRDKCLLKIKQFEDAEFEIIGFKTDPLKTVAESLVFELQNDINNKTFFARPTGTNKMKDKWYELLSENLSNILGKKATIRFKDRSEDGIPLHGTLRHKNTTCLIECIRDYE